MPILRCFTLLILLAARPAAAQQNPTIYDRPLSDRRVSYDMVVRLTPDTRTVEGVERITWRNDGPAPVSELQFHLYLNAFSSPRTTFMREGGAEHRGFSSSHADRWGGVEINRMVIASDPPLLHGDFDVVPSPSGTAPGTDVTDSIRFIRPDDGNAHDFTAIAVDLPEPVLPGETVAINVDFSSRLPRVTARTGWAEKDNGSLFFFVGQWFPKIAVYELPGQRYVPADAPEGQWNTHQFHQNSEWYADFGTYRVAITVPSDYVVGATGVRTAELETDGAATYTYVADDVHDFAWTASQDYLEYLDGWEHVELRLLLQPEHDDQAQRHFDAAKVSLKYFAEWYGEYPYTNLTLVDGVGGSNGMEYPTLITCGTTYGLPEWARFLELVTIHEFGHQYWYGMLASNEFEEAWLDEGINSYTEMRIMDAEYGFGSALAFPGLEIDDSDIQRLLYTKNSPTRGAIYADSWTHRSGDYSKVSYAKPAVVLGTLEGLIGPEKMRELMRTYYERWRFRHPTTRDFIDVAEEIAGEDLSWYFDQFVYGAVAVDNRVSSVSAKRLMTGDSTSATGENEPEMHRSTIVLHRDGEGYVPVDVLVRFEDSQIEIVHWDDPSDWTTLEFDRPARVAEVYVDPENVIMIDLNRLNNRWIEGSDASAATKYGLKYLMWIQQFLQAITGLL